MKGFLRRHLIPPSLCELRRSIPSPVSRFRTAVRDLRLKSSAARGIQPGSRCQTSRLATRVLANGDWDVAEIEALGWFDDQRRVDGGQFAAIRLGHVLFVVCPITVDFLD